MSEAEQGPLPARPLLAPWYRRTHDGRRVLLEYGDSILALEGRGAALLLPELLPLLDGTRSFDELAEAVGETRRPALAKAIALLAAEGVLVDGPNISDETAALCAATASVPAAPAEIEQRLGSARVAIAGSGVAAAELQRLLAESIDVAARVDWDCAADELGDVDLAVAAPASVELDRVADWNERLLDLRVPWLQALPFNGRLAAIGPLFVPGETCCHVCFQLRRAAAAGDAAEFLALERTPAPYPVGLALGAAVAGLAATLALRWLATAEPSLPGALFALELEDGLRLQRHRVFRFPRCPACSGALTLSPPLPWAEDVVR